MSTEMHVKLIGKTNLWIKIPANPYPMYPFVEQLNCISIDSATGQRHVFNHGPTRINASIVWKAVHYDVVRQYEVFILRVAEMGASPFTITCPPYIDFGRAKGNDITDAYYAGPPTLKDIITPRGDAGLYYDIELPYMFVRSD